MPHNPTSTGKPNWTPTTCFCCSRHAFGIGFGDFGRDGKGDPKWLCETCIMLLAQIKAVRSFDAYENAAIDMAIEGVGGLIENYGTDLSEWTESQVRQFVMEIILGFGDAIREQIKAGEVPF